MTVDTTGGGNLPAQLPDDLSTGLEDFGVEDAVIPRLQILHKEAKFKDNLSGQEFESLQLIILGLVKQRILWHHDTDEGDMPMCKSANFQQGYPDMDAPKKKSFPWDKAGFDPDDFPENEDGQKVLPCANCHLKDWGTHPQGDKPYCSEQWTLSVLYDPEKNGNYMPAILTLQKSGIKPIRSYLTSFARANTAAFTKVAEAKLKLNSRGSVDYSIPNFVTVGDTDRDNWAEYSNTFRQMRNYLMRAPEPRDDEEPKKDSDNTNTAPPQAQAQTVQAEEPKTEEPPAEQPPAPAADTQQADTPTAQAASDGDDDDDLPF